MVVGWCYCFSLYHFLLKNDGPKEVTTGIKHLSNKLKESYQIRYDSFLYINKIIPAFQPRKDKLRKLFREASSSDDDPVWDTYHVL